MNEVLKDVNPHDVTNSQILDALHELDERQRKAEFTEEERSYLKTLVKERQAFSIVFSKSKVILGVVAGALLTFIAIIKDWGHIKDLIR